jgi:hypothetical protein
MKNWNNIAKALTNLSGSLQFSPVGGARGGFQFSPLGGVRGGRTLLGRGWGRLGGLLFLLLIGFYYAQAQEVPIPDPDWPLDSVVNGSVHRYTVPGDLNYEDPSYFVWTVSGGRLFRDYALTVMAGDGTTATVVGNGDNVTHMFVVWDSFDTPLDTGYIYVYEISALGGCQRADNDRLKYQGMRVKVSSPPKARFITDETIVCAYDDSTHVIVEIEGMPPYDLTYAIDGVQYTRRINPEDLLSLDDDGETDNISFFMGGYRNITSDEVHTLRLIEVSSGGVVGDIFDYREHTVIAHVQPPAPEIFTEWTEVTTGTANTYTYQLSDPGINPVEWYWNLRNEGTNLIDSYTSTSPTYPLVFNSPPGNYYIEVRYLDNYGCLSYYGQMDIELFDIPTIQFVDNDTIINCSATTLIPDEKFEFRIEYSGARTYGFTYEVYDYEGNVVDGGALDQQTSRSNIITIQNRFINDELPEEIRPWRVVIKTAYNEEPGVDVNILDSNIEGGRDERVILIYPKPFIHDDIDFAN